MTRFELRHDPLDLEELLGFVQDPRAGGIDLFTGQVRNHHEGRQVLALEYEAYEPMVEKVGQRLLAEAAERFEVVHLAAAHRVGRLAVGEAAIIIVASAAHRDAAFQACRYVIDRIKHEAPIWKKEYHPDGAEWVLCSHGHAPAEMAEGDRSAQHSYHVTPGLSTASNWNEVLRLAAAIRPSGGNGMKTPD